MKLTVREKRHCSAILMRSRRTQDETSGSTHAHHSSVVSRSLMSILCPPRLHIIIKIAKRCGVIFRAQSTSCIIKLNAAYCFWFVWVLQKIVLACHLIYKKKLIQSLYFPHLQYSTETRNINLTLLLLIITIVKIIS